MLLQDRCAFPSSSPYSSSRPGKWGSLQNSSAREAGSTFGYIFPVMGYLVPIPPAWWGGGSGGTWKPPLLLHCGRHWCGGGGSLPLTTSSRP